jgi:hypothetical protein
MTKQPKPVSEIREAAARTIKKSSKLRAESEDVIQVARKAQEMAKRVLGGGKSFEDPLG